MNMKSEGKVKETKKVYVVIFQQRRMMIHKIKYKKDNLFVCQCLL